MKALWVLLFLLIMTAGYSAVVNSIVASVGNYAITTYDIEKMNEFLIIGSGGTKSQDPKAGLKELLYTYALYYLADKETKMTLSKGEIDSAIASITNNTNTSDPGAAYRIKLFQEYPDQYRMKMKKSQIMRALAYYNRELKDKLGREVSEKEARDFYQKNQSNFMEPPSVDMVVVLAPQPKDLSLDELDNYEKNLNLIADTLKKTDNVTNLIDKYKKGLSLDPVSGRTGMLPAFELIKNGIPEEIVFLSLTTNSIRSSKGMILIKNGAVVGPELYQFRKSPKPQYFIFKLIQRKTTSITPFEKVRQMVEFQIKDNKSEEIINQFIQDKVLKNEIKITIIDKNYEGAYNELFRR